MILAEVKYLRRFGIQLSGEVLRIPRICEYCRVLPEHLITLQGAGPPLRPRAGRGRPERSLDLDVVSVSKIASMLEKAREHAQPVLPATAGSPGGRFARDPSEYASRQSSEGSVQLALIPGGADQPTTRQEHDR